MPKSKRNKVVSLTRTQKRATRDAKASLIERIRDAVDAYPFLHLISVSSMRNASMQRVREDLKGRARFFFGKNRVVARALADRNAAAAAAANDDQNAAAGEYRPSLARVAALLRGPVGVCFATVDAKELQEILDMHRCPYFAKAGSKALRTVSLPAGPLLRRVEPADVADLDEAELGPSYLPTKAATAAADPDATAPFPNNMETQLRALGMPTALKAGAIHILQPFTVCTAGAPLTPSQAHLLKHLNLMTATFRVDVFAQWRATGGELTQLADHPFAGGDADGDDADGDEGFEDAMDGDGEDADE